MMDIRDKMNMSDTEEGRRSVLGEDPGNEKGGTFFRNVFLVL